MPFTAYSFVLTLTSEGGEETYVKNPSQRFNIALGLARN